MKPNIKIAVFIFSLMLVFFYSNLFSQCDHKTICKEDFGDFDYSSQSSYAKLSPGDTATVKIVVYSGKAYRIIVCGEKSLGDFKYKIVTPVRKGKRSFTVKERNINEQLLKPDANGYVYDNSGNKYKLDADGNLVETRSAKNIVKYIRNETGDYASADGAIVPYSNLKLTEHNSKTSDTTWTSERYTDEELIFDSKSNKTGKSYWEETINKTKRVFIKIEIPPGNKTLNGCLGVYIGTKMLSSKNFAKTKVENK
jgi:hypothetical protein